MAEMTQRRKTLRLSETEMSVGVARRSDSAFNGKKHPLPEVRRLIAFLVLADELHYGHAAARLPMGQSPLSRLIRSLERDLDAVLFDRSRHYVRLTAAGESLCKRAFDIVEAMEQAASAARALDQSSLVTQPTNKRELAKS